jgi:hypothetical protein
MYQVFSHAYVTLVVAAGEDCNAGIPFVQKAMRCQYTATLSGTLVASSRSRAAVDRDFLDSKWASRAWVSTEIPKPTKYL